MAKTPDFPSKVWLAIFDHATFVPFALDTRRPDPFGYPRTPTHERTRKGIVESMRTKRNLVLVCRNWNALATRFLYQAIVITRSEASQGLLRAISSEPVGGAAPDLPNPVAFKGQWTVRLYIVLPTGDSPPEGFFASLLQGMPNLQILVVYRPNYALYSSSDTAPFLDIAPLFDTLATKAVPSLQVLHVSWQGNQDKDGRQFSIPEAIKGRPLRVFVCRLIDWREKEKAYLYLPNIEYLDVPDAWTEPLLANDNVSPSLVSLSLSGKMESSNRIAQGLLPRVRPNLDMLHADDVLGTVAMPLTYNLTEIYRPLEPKGPNTVAMTRPYHSRFDTLMHRIANYYPNLQHLVINVDIKPEIALWLPPVTKLGLRINIFDSDKGRRLGWWKDLCRTIKRLVSITPSLEVVRLLRPVSHNYFEQGFEELVDIMRQTSSTLLSTHNVRFEDCDGQLLHMLEFTLSELPCPHNLLFGENLL